MKKFLFYTILIIYCIFTFPYQGQALTESEIRQQIEDTNNQIEALDKEIKQYQSQIAKTSEQANSLAKIIKELTLTRSKLVKEKEQIEKKIKATGLVIKTLSSDIKDKEQSISISRQSLSKMLKDLNQNDNTLIIERLLSIDNFTEFSREYNDILSLNEKIRENIIDISLKKGELENSKTQKEGEKQNLNLLKNNLVQKEQAVAVTKKEKDTLLNQTKNKEAEYKKLLLERQKIKETFENSLEAYEAQLKFILNPKLLPKEGSGVLAWPLDYILVTSQYGARWGRFHYGLDFRASVGTSVKAMADGVVEGAGDTDVACKGASFGKWIFIKYDNGLSSTYGHLSVISVKKGQKVKTGDVVGLSGNTGSSTGPHLHVAVYASDGVKVDTVPSKSCNGKIFTQPISALSAYLNPALYLPKITSAMVKK
ncbi:MAG: peptidoglycan DD-metalloendopeptidase family protein [Candidatus Paceibacterota bacterium]|jgi:murein DD-endopeptidase MepM/ murein hydrolase activator NlpD